VLAASLAVTHQLWRSAREGVQRDVREYFDFRVRGVETRVAQRMLAYEQVLRGIAGFLGASRRVERHEFRDYVASLRLEESHPGIRRLGFAVRVPAASKDQHVARVRAEGFPGFAIQPDGRREEYSSVVFLEPFVGDVQRAFGYDGLTDPLRRAAMERARDSGRAALTGKLKLVQEPESGGQAGCLMYLPVFRAGVPGTLADRRAGIVGWVYAAFRMGDLMNGIFGERASDLDVEIYDGPEASKGALMYDADGHPFAGDPSRAPFTAVRSLEIGGRRWTLAIHTLPGFEARLAIGTPRVVAAAGLGASALLTLLVWLLASGRARAHRAARRMNRELLEAQAALQERAQELRKSEERLRLALASGTHAEWDWDIPSDRLSHGPSWPQMIGREPGELIETLENWKGIVHPDDLGRTWDALQACVQGRTRSYEGHYRVRHALGGWRWVRSRGRVVERDAQGRALRMAGTRTDVTELDELQERVSRTERLASLGTLVAGMSHEINNPLACTIANLVYVSEQLQALPAAAREAWRAAETDAPGELAEALDEATAGARRVRDIVADLKSFAAGQHSATAGCRVGTALESALKLAHHDLMRCSEVRVELPAEMPEVGATQAELVQVFAGLLANAGQATGPGPNVVEVSAELREPDQVVVRIADTGAGIDENALPHVFDPFFSTRGVGGGRGLGLSAALGIVRGIGGDIQIASAVGKGTLASVVLPVRASEQRAG
jgi:PAS domain S-box-containing protein